MKNLGKVVEIFSAKEGSSGFPRPRANSLELIESFGIKDDKFAGKDLNKSVMIIGNKSYDIAKEHGIELLLGSFGENITFDFDPHELLVGDTLVIADAEMVITEKCTVCSHLQVFGKDLPKIIAHKRGLYCKITKNGTVYKDLPIYLKGKR